MACLRLGIFPVDSVSQHCWSTVVTLCRQNQNVVRHKFLVSTSCWFLLKKMSNDILISKRVDSSERHGPVYFIIVNFEKEGKILSKSK